MAGTGNNIEIDPVKYGVLWEKVQGMERDLSDIKDDLKALNGRIDQLVDLANRSRGAIWVVMTIVGLGAGVMAFITHLIKIMKGG